MRYVLTLSFLKENKHRFDLGKIVIENQGHSGMSFGLMCSMLEVFYEKEAEFVNYVRKYLYDTIG